MRITAAGVDLPLSDINTICSSFELPKMYEISGKKYKVSLRDNGDIYVELVKPEVPEPPTTPRDRSEFNF